MYSVLTCWYDVSLVSLGMVKVVHCTHFSDSIIDNGRHGNAEKLSPSRGRHTGASQHTGVLLIRYHQATEAW